MFIKYRAIKKPIKNSTEKLSQKNNDLQNSGINEKEKKTNFSKLD